jgi:hypothetical protein
MTLRLFSLVTSLLAIALAGAGQAHASTSQESVFQDDRMLQNYGPTVQALALNDLQTLGVDSVHAVVLWKDFAPRPTDGSVPDGFDGTDPRSYDAGAMATLDDLVRGAQARGLSVILTPSGPGPVWSNGKDCTTSERRRATRGTCRPDAKLYGQFVTALAKRYSGSYTDPSVPAGAAIPRVSRWGLWNEPNLNSWIYPSAVSIRGKHVPVSAKIYRALVYAGGNALRANGHSGDQILLGETGPLGQGVARTAPVSFYRALFCVGDRGRRLTGSAARSLGCPKRIKRLPVNGIAHHPYTKGAAQRLTAKQHSTDVTIAGLGALRAVLKQGVKAKAISSGTASHVLLTEFGVSSSPPARPRSYGLSLSRQAEAINQGEFIAYQNPAIRGTAQFQLEDDPLAAGSAGSKLTFQTGLRYSSVDGDPMAPELGKPKPSYEAYKVPLFVVDRGRNVTVWGGVRGVSSGRVKVLNGLKTVKTVKLRHGYFLTKLKKRKGTWQLSYGSGASLLKSRVAKPVKP